MCLEHLAHTFSDTVINMQIQTPTWYILLSCHFPAITELLNTAGFKKAFFFVCFFLSFPQDYGISHLHSRCRVCVKLPLLVAFSWNGYHFPLQGRFSFTVLANTDAHCYSATKWWNVAIWCSEWLMHVSSAQNIFFQGKNTADKSFQVFGLSLYECIW